MDNRLDKLKEKVEEKKEKLYYSMTAEDPNTLDKIDEIVEKYARKFEELGIKCRVKDRR